MENPDELATGRVTRSLRKRLNSIDSDASSRPGTPANQKLTAITETILTTRAVRRNSTSTPVQTPLKMRAIRGTTPELNSSARRVTRRSSLSLVEDEHTSSTSSVIKDILFDALIEEESKEVAKLRIAQVKTLNVNSPARRNTRLRSISVSEEEQTSAPNTKLIKDLKFETLAEEQETIKPPKRKSAKGIISNSETAAPEKRVTRSQSGSPEQVQEKLESTRSQIRSKRTANRSGKEEDSQVNVINFESDDDTTSDSNRVETPKPLQQIAADNVIDIIEGTPIPEEAGDIEKIIKQKKNESVKESGEIQENGNDVSQPETISKMTDASEVDNEPSTPLKEQSAAVVTEVVFLKRLTPSDIAHYTGSKSPELHIKLQSDTKSVTFNDFVEDELKTTYPKTPAPMKSKSYRDANCSKETAGEDISFQSDKGSVASFKEAKCELETKEDHLDTSKESALFHDATNNESNNVDGDVPQKKDNGSASSMLPEKTLPKPTKLLKSEQSSTPIVASNLSPKSTSKPLQEKNDEDKVEEKNNERELTRDKFPENVNDSKESSDIAPLLLSPEKFLRSGKVYGSTPPNSSSRDSPKSLNKSADFEIICAQKQETLLQTQKTGNSSGTQKSPRTLIHAMNEAANQDDKTEMVEKCALSKAVYPRDKGEKPDYFVKSWLQSVSSKVGETGSKIDAITGSLIVTPIKEATEKIVEEKVIQSDSAVQRQSRYESDDEEDGSVLADIEQEEELEISEHEEFVEEKPFVKHAFIDNEAIEADADYCSGDSMDEEDRRYMEENEISVDGESIGSEDTEEDADDDDSDEDSKNEGSFIVASDDEEEIILLDYSDDNEHMDDIKKNHPKKKRPFKRIKLPSSDSDSAEEQENGNTPTTGLRKSEEIKNDNSFEVEGKRKGEQFATSLELALEVSKMINESITDEEMLAMETETTDVDVVKSEDRRHSISPKSVTEKVINEEKMQNREYPGIAHLSNTDISTNEWKEVNVNKSINSNEETSKLNEYNLLLQATFSENSSSEDEETAHKQIVVRRKSLKKLYESEHFNNSVYDINETQHSLSSTAVVDGVNDKKPQEKANAFKLRKSRNSSDLNKSSKKTELLIRRKSLNKSLMNDKKCVAESDKEPESRALDDAEEINDDKFKINKSLNNSSEEREMTMDTNYENGNEKISDDESGQQSNTSNLKPQKYLNTSHSNDKQSREMTEKDEYDVSEHKMYKNEVSSEYVKNSRRMSLSCSALVAKINNSRNSESQDDKVKDIVNQNNSDASESVPAEAAIGEELNLDTIQNSMKKLSSTSVSLQHFMHKQEDQTATTMHNEMDLILAEQGTKASSTTENCNDKDKDSNDKDKDSNDKDKDSNDKDKDSNDKDTDSNDKDKDSNDKDNDSNDNDKDKDSNDNDNDNDSNDNDNDNDKDNDNDNDTDNDDDNDNAMEKSSSSNSISRSEHFEADYALSSESEYQLEQLKYTADVPGQYLKHLERRQTLGMPIVTCGSDSISKTIKLKRQSTCLPLSEDKKASRSFIENVVEHKRELQQAKLSKKRRLSKSFCGSLDTTAPATPEAVCHLHKKSKIAKNESGIEVAAAAPNSSTPHANSGSNNMERILGRCEKILEAANRAKLEAKVNYKKSKIRVNRKHQNHAASSNNDAGKKMTEAVVVNQSMDMKRKEKTRSAVEQALKASDNILLNPPCKNKPKLDEQKLESKRLPTQFLELICDNAEIVSNKTKVDKKKPENIGIIHKIKSIAGDFTEFPLSPKTKKKTEKIELATGTICVEPLTPKKKDNISGFRECPLTPRTTGFKVRQILTAGQDTPPVYAASPSSSMARKRRHQFEEPSHTLPKPQWTKSGVFLEQEILPKRVISTHSSATQFVVSALGGSKNGKKGNNIAYPHTSAINGNALNFKKNAFCRSVVSRESSREMFLRKERQNGNNNF